ncbi:venom serine protease 34-like [Ctenocephalides felis]|uniref:venom serine protease 34-like n=1 Tax=Ctenocephalides felis TaxID=7515 RepID=UPI000E6E1D59|nr:venom serine protease 34-like [Ctenocephalides felis]
MIALLMLLVAWPVVNGQYPNCDYYQNMQLDMDYYVYSPNYPSNYPPGSSCRWYAEAPIGSRITLTCSYIELPQSTNCDGDRLLISPAGKVDLSDAQRYCGKGTLTQVSTANTMNIVLHSVNNGGSGRFLCSIRATQSAQQCNCGWKKTTRIVGGVETGINEYPMMAGLIDYTNKIVYCGATIISNRYLVTAAHCVINRIPSGLGVLVGDHDISTGSETGSSRLYGVENVRIHERFDAVTYQNDIAIIRTNADINFSQEVGPACLPFNYRGTNFAGAYVTALGWGATGFGETTSNRLMKVQLNVQTNDVCSKHYPNRLGPGQLCTYADGQDSCQVV